MMRSTRFRLGASLLIGSALVACALDPLNPQPLPPAPEASFGMDAGAYIPSPNDAGKQSVGDDDDTDNAADAGAVPTSPADVDAGDAGTCKPTLPTTFTPTFTAPAKQTACSADDIKGYYDACVPELKKQSCTDWLSAHAQCATCIEAPNAKGPIQVFRDRTYYTLNTAGCVALIQGKSDDTSCAKAYDTALSCRRASCDGCFAKASTTFKDFVDCQKLASEGACKNMEAASAAKCVGFKDPDGGAPQCFATTASEDPKLVYTRVANAFCLKP